jgi:multisubunit Na+/H+ antiporter MnhB subunit
MTNPASTRNAPRRDRTTTSGRRTRRRTLARLLPVGVCLGACVLLSAAAAVDGGVAALVLAAWVALLVAVGLRLTTVEVDVPAPRPELLLAEFDDDGEIGEATARPVVATPSAAYVLHARPRG